MHKIIAGLIDVYKFTHYEIAYEIVSKLGDWVYVRTKKWTPEIQANVLSVEYGGMNDCMYELFKITQDEKYSFAAHKFDEATLFTQISNGDDILNNRHANTTIPKFLGALNRYLVYGEKESFYLDACKQFWNMVVENHSYITGGNSEGEHFGEANILNAERTALNCETCNSYNMLKLSRGLFQITGEKKYLDFYENTFINAILSSQNPTTGMTMYFQPMATGFFKIYSKPFEHFWCCTGTGMENFSKLNDSLYFYNDNKLYVNMYLSSNLNWNEKQVHITQSTEIPSDDNATFIVNTEKDTEFVFYFRIPSWSKGVCISINDTSSNLIIQNGYAIVQRVWRDNDVIDVRFEFGVSFSSLPDSPNTIAFNYGPFVLSAGLGVDQMEESNTGILVKIPSKHVEIKDFIVIKGQSIESWMSNFKNNLIRTKSKLEFTLRGTDEDNRLKFTPHYKQHTERYGIYWTVVEEDSIEFKRYLQEKQYTKAMNAAEIDSIQVGNDQYELCHHIDGKETEAGDREGYHYRVAKHNGWFSYDIQVSCTEDTYLHIDYYFADCKEGFEIYINNLIISHEQRADTYWNELITKTYFIPKECIGSNNRVTVKFKASDTDYTARIVNQIRTTKKI